MKRQHADAHIVRAVCGGCALSSMAQVTAGQLTGVLQRVASEIARLHKEQKKLPREFRKFLSLKEQVEQLLNASTSIHPSGNAIVRSMEEHVLELEDVVLNYTVARARCCFALRGVWGGGPHKYLELFDERREDIAQLLPRLAALCEAVVASNVAQAHNTLLHNIAMLATGIAVVEIQPPGIDLQQYERLCRVTASSFGVPLSFDGKDAQRVFDALLVRVGAGQAAIFLIVRSNVYLKATLSSQVVDRYRAAHQHADNLEDHLSKVDNAISPATKQHIRAIIDRVRVCTSDAQLESSKDALMPLIDQVNDLCAP